MAKSAASPGKGGPFDLEKLRELLEMMEKHGLTEINLKHGDEQWRLRRGPLDQPQLMASPPYPVAAPQPPVPAAAPPTEESVSAAGGDLPANIAVIKSPTVGTFYTSPSPDDPPFVNVGDRVNPDTVVCIVEAMKVFNQIPAEISGTITEVLVANGDPVEFGQPLFKVQTG
ncbi:MAG: acetyl-CoA carboxylase biotin carboxyl carrier protein [Planctomycetaceae bacterium]